MNTTMHYIVARHKLLDIPWLTRTDNNFPSFCKSLLSAFDWQFSMVLLHIASNFSEASSFRSDSWDSLWLCL